MRVQQEPTPEQMKLLRKEIEEAADLAEILPNLKNLTDEMLAWALIHKFRLVIRPSLIATNWFAGRLQAITGDGKIIVEAETTIEAPGCAQAIFHAALKVIELDEREEELYQLQVVPPSSESIDDAVKFFLQGNLL